MTLSDKVNLQKIKCFVDRDLQLYEIKNLLNL